MPPIHVCLSVCPFVCLQFVLFTHVLTAIAISYTYERSITRKQFATIPAIPRFLACRFLTNDHIFVSLTIAATMTVSFSFSLVVFVRTHMYTRGIVCEPLINPQNETQRQSPAPL